MLNGWRETTVSTLARSIGPAADLIVDEVLAALQLTDREMVPSNYLKFLSHLERVLPDTLDRKNICGELREKVMLGRLT